MAWRVEAAYSVFETLSAALLVAFLVFIVYLLVRFVMRMRSDDELDVPAHHWSDQVTGGRREQTPDEAVEEWERKRRHRPWASRHRRLLVVVTAALLAAAIVLAAYLYLSDEKTRPGHCSPPSQCD